jgi:hypothetical protein
MIFRTPRRTAARLLAAIALSVGLLTVAAGTPALAAPAEVSRVAAAPTGVSIKVWPAYRCVKAGQKTSYVVTVTVKTGSPKDLAIGLDGKDLPEEVSFGFDSNPSGTRVTLNMWTSTHTPHRRYTLVFLADDNNGNHLARATATLNVR